ncbi:MAG: UDP-3-O-(3-hydroxymyristoyl)glucosamine N-acyltransferase [Deltaproteobacteria bacterium]|nr:UDP-3-O-(3-hydroxymyristoyl)glucosamine N-acyltransferase [Deltaproteobacteria bacterium]
MKRTLGELAALLQGEVKGPPDLEIEGLAAVEDAGPREITFIAQKRYARLAGHSQAGAFIVAPDLADLARPLIIVPHPYLAYARVAALFAPARRRWSGISDQAYLGRDLTLGREVSIAPLAFIGDRVRLDDGVTVMPGCFLGDEVHVGAGSLIYPNVTILERCQVGQRCIIHSGTVIGADGFGFVPTPAGNEKIPQLGTVVIEDDVEIGANCTIDRGALGETRLGRGVKIDNLVHLAHNVTVGEHSLLVAQVGVSGSTKLGRRVILAGQVGLVGHIELGDGVRVGAQSGLNHSVPAGQDVSGSPAFPHKQWLQSIAHIPKLPDLYRRLKRVEKQLAELAARLDKEPET